MAHALLPGIDAAWEKAVPFQVEDGKFFGANNGGVVGHQTGLGKTFISLLAWSLWPSAQKALVLGSLASTATWMRLLEVWGKAKFNFIQGNDQSAWQEACQARTGIWLCSYATYLWLMKGVVRGKPRFDLVANDELHKALRHRNSTWKAIKRLDYDHYLGCSGTWTSRGPQDLYPVLNLLNPRLFPSYWRFVNTWCHVEKTSYGTEIFGVKNLDNLRKMLWSQFYRARTWPEVGSQFGATYKDPVVKRREPVAMGRQQAELIQELDKEMIVMLGNEMVVTPNSLALLTRKLQMAISPKILLPSAEWGGPIEWLASKIADGPHTVVFCPFREGLDVLKAKLIHDKRPESEIFVLRGGTAPTEVYRTIDQWKKVKGVMLCTFGFAESFPLDSTDTAYGLGFDWDPNINEQAEGRLRRLDSEIRNPCLLTYIIPQYSDYMYVEAVLDGKVVNTRDYMRGFAKNTFRIDLKDLPMAPEEDDDIPA